MMSNYRKSPGRFGEIDNEVGIERPPVRPSIAFPNARNALRNPGSEGGAPSMESSDSTPTTALYFSTTEADDMSSLGDDPSIFAVLFPETAPTKSTPDDVIVLTNSQTTSPTMTTLMDLVHTSESPSEQQLQWNVVKVVEKGTIDPEPLSDVVKKKKKKKKRLGETTAKKTKVAVEKKKSKGEKSKTKASKTKEDATSTRTKKQERPDREKKKSSPADPSSDLGIKKSTKDPTNKETKKSRKSDASPPELNKKEEKKLKKSIKADVVVPPSTQQKLKNNASKTKEKVTTRETSSGPTDSSPDVSPATKDINSHKIYKRKSASDDMKSRPLCSSAESNNSTSMKRLNSMLPSVDEKTDDCFFDARSYSSCARSTFTYDCFDLPDSTKLYNADRGTITSDIGGLSGTPNRTLELAIASAPKERPTGTDPKAQKKSKGHFLRRLFGENHSTQGCQ